VRWAAQLLSGEPARDPVAVVERLLAVQAQDPRGARLAIRARTAGLSATDVDRALTDRALCISWLCRRTLHLVRREDYRWLQALTTPPLHTGNTRRLAQEGVTPDAAERGVAVIERCLAAEGPLTREQLRERIRAAGVRTEGQALVHLLELASLRGLIVRGPITDRGRHAFVLVRDWFGDPGAVDRDAALAELARRYLAGHGPAGDRDLAKWAGLPLRDVRRGLAAIASELEQGSDGLVDLAGRPGGDVLPAPRLLGAFDPVLHGWATREPILGPHEPRVVSGGLFRPFVLAAGRGVALWRLAGAAVEVTPFEPLAEEVTSALASDGEDVVRFLGIGRVTTDRVTRDVRRTTACGVRPPQTSSL